MLSDERDEMIHHENNSMANVAVFKSPNMFAEFGRVTVFCMAE